MDPRIKTIRLVLLSLAAAGLFVISGPVWPALLAFFWACYPCCAGAPCSICSTSTPAEVQLTFTGIANAGGCICTNATVLNKTAVLPQSSSNACRYAAVVPDTDYCNGGFDATFHVRFDTSLGGNISAAYNNGVAFTTLSTPYDCTQERTLTTWNQLGSGCNDHSSASAIIQPL
jgi:hypothetical protein